MATVSVPAPRGVTDHAGRTALRGVARGGVRVARALGRALLTVVPVAFIATFGTFTLAHLSDSNPAAEALGETATPEAIAQLNHTLGLDRPLIVQYADWIGSALQGDLGTSYFTGIPVATSIKLALPVDLALTFFAIVVAVAVGGAAGVVAALRAGGRR